MSSTPTPPDINLTLDSISAGPIPPPSDELQLAATLEKKDYEKEQQKILLLEQRQNLEGRGAWANRIFKILVAWLIAVVAVIALQGFQLGKFHLSDAVIIAFISTTTVNVLTLAYIVANYLFLKPK